MVGIVVVSHSSRLAESVVELAREMASPDLAIEAAGGLDAGGGFGTSATVIAAAIGRAWSEDGVLVLMDLGSAVLSAEAALELIDPRRRARVLLSDAPLAEGAVIAAVGASAGNSLAETAGEARRALELKTAHLDRQAEIAEPAAAIQAGPTFAEPFCLTGLPAAGGIAYGEARHPGPGGLAGPGILLVRALSPAEATLLDPSVVFGVAAAGGDPAAHGAAVARSLGIPAVTGLGEAIFGVPEGMELLLDGEAGLLYGEASREIGAAYRFRAAALEATDARARGRAGEPALTVDGELVRIIVAATDAGALADSADLLSIDADSLARDVMGAGPSGHADYLQPAVLALIGRAVEAAEATATPVSVHGTVGGDGAAIPLLVGLGLRQITVPAEAVARVKESIRGLDAGEARGLATKSLTLDSAAEVRRLVAGFLGADVGARRPQMGTRQMPEGDTSGEESR